MSKDKLAILGGEKVFKEVLHPFNSMGQEEIEAVNKVMKSGTLSGYYGSWGKEFYGGPAVQNLEKAWSSKFKIKHAVAVNSAASGLMSAVGAIGISPGDEVIVPPMTQGSTIMAVVLYGGIPVFADLDPITCCLDIHDVKKKITSKTKAIMVVNLFGHISNLHALKKLSDEKKLFLIEDNAQAPLGTENGIYAGTIAHIGIFSLNYHKHLHSGEGGICCTNDDVLALKLQLIRNHAEGCVEDSGLNDLTNMIGFNFRMTEMSAAVGLEQLKKIEDLVKIRENIALKLNDGLDGLDGIKMPIQRENTRAVYYMYQMQFNPEIIGVTREVFCKALLAEGFPTFVGYVEPLYLLPMLQKRIAFGNNGYPFNLSDQKYDKGICPVAERLHEESLIGFDCCTLEVKDHQIDLLIDAFRKVYKHKDDLKLIN